MKTCKALLIALLLMLLTISSALAEFDAVPESRIHFTKPDGLKADVSTSDGLLRIAVNTEDTDWEALLNTSYDGDMKSIILPLQVSAPTGATGSVSSTFRYKNSTPPDEVFEEILADVKYNSGIEPGSSARWFLEAAQYIASSEMMQPSTLYTDYTFLMLYRWYDNGGAVVRTEQLQVIISFTSSGMFKVERKATPKGNIRAGFVRAENSSSFTQVGSDVMNTTVQDGSVLYEIPDISAIGTENNGRIYTFVAVPQALINSGKPVENWWCTNSFMGNVHTIEIQGDSAVGYYIELPIPFPGVNGEIESESYALSWGYEEKTVDYGTLDIRIVCGDPMPWPAYVSGWKTVPKAHMDLSKYDVLKDTMDITYDRDTGILHFGMKGNTLPSVDGLDNMNWKPVVKLPEEGAAAYNCWNISTNELYGSQFTAEMQAAMEKALSRPENRKVIPAGATSVTLDGSSLFIAYHPSMQGVSSAEAQEVLAKQTVYLSAGMTGKYAGDTQVIYWYKNASDSEPFKVEYLIDTREEFALLQESKAQLELGEEVTLPVFLIDSAHEKTDCHLIIRTYPQADGQYIYYELQLISREEGKPDEPVKLEPGLTYRLHIPYPKGYNKASEDVTFIIRHLNNNHEVTEIFDESGFGGIERTEDGLIITIKSLSPFELIWYAPEEAVNPSQLPQTGDTSRLPLWLALTLTSIAALHFLRRRLAHRA